MHLGSVKIWFILVFRLFFRRCLIKFLKNMTILIRNFIKDIQKRVKK